MLKQDETELGDGFCNKRFLLNTFLWCPLHTYLITIFYCQHLFTNLFVGGGACTLQLITHH